MDFRKYDKTTEFGVVYKDTKSGKFYGKRCVIGKFITDREYQLCPDNCKLEIFTPRTDAIYLCKVEHRMKDKQEMELNLKELPMRSAKARGFLISSKPITKITHVRYLEADELAAINGEEPPDNGDDVEDNENEIQDIDLPSEADESSDNNENENDSADVEAKDTAPAKKAEEKPETKVKAKTSKTKTPEKVEPKKQEAEKPESEKPTEEPASENRKRQLKNRK
jgi:topoisomerase-4 subunit A